MRVLVTGGAGFIGSTISVSLAARHADWEVVAFDNLSRRGSELTLPRLRAAGVRFVLGAYHALELARRDNAQFVFLSTSRIYPVKALNEIALVEEATRFELAEKQTLAGVSSAGISENFPLAGARTLYGATKLSGELLVEEYANAYGLRTVVNRFGVVAGPWQMGKVDQGIFTHWLLAHYFRRPLQYIGFGGSGKQVRDLLHVDDLVDLIDDQLSRADHWAGVTANAGGGRPVSLSLLEATEICRELTGNAVEIGKASEDRPGDIPVYLSDCARLYEYTAWRPKRDPRTVLAEIFDWVKEYESALVAALESGS